MFSFSFYWTVAAVLFTLLSVVWTLFIWTLLVIVGWWPRGGAGMDVFRGSHLSSTVPLGSKFWLFLVCVCVCVGQAARWLLCPHRWPFHCLLFYSCMCRLWVFSLLYNIRNCCISCLNNNIVILGGGGESSVSVHFSTIVTCICEPALLRLHYSFIYENHSKMKSTRVDITDRARLNLSTTRLL